MQIFVLSLIWFVSLDQLLFAQELASAPYTDLKRSINASITKESALVAIDVRLRVRTTNPHAAPGELKLWLDIDGERTEIRVAEDGSLTLPPVDDNVAASAWIRSNQPKGTLSFSATYELDLKQLRGKRVENALVIRYDDIFAMNAMRHKVEEELMKEKFGRDSRMTARGIDAIVFSQGNSDQPSRVAIKTKESTIDVRPSDGKEYRIPFKRSLVSEPSVIVLIPHTGWKLKAELTPPTTTEIKTEASVAR